MTNKVKVNGVNIYYELYGKGSPIVLIAGFACDHSFWAGVVTELAKNHQVLIFDNRGIGQSDAPDSPYSIDLMADDTHALIHALGIKNPVLVGQSMGSAIAQNMAYRYPSEFKKLVLINTFYQIDKLPALVFDAVRDLHKLNVPIEYRTKTLAPWIFSAEFLSRPQQMETLMNLAKTNPYPQTLTGFERQFEALKEFDSRTLLCKIKVPVLILAAEEDLITPVENSKFIAEVIGHKTELIVLPGGHASPVEQPEKVTKSILAFL